MLENQKILAVGGRRESGKNTVCNFIHSLALVFFKCTPSARIDPDTGELVVVTEEGEEGVFDLNNRDPEFIEYMTNHVWPFIRKFSFAAPFKDACVNIFGIPAEYIYGTNEQKNSLTKFKWEDMPIPAPRYLKGKNLGERAVGKVTLDLPIHLDKDGNKRTGYMTAREFMQYFGSQIGREIYNEVWSDKVLSDIEKSESGICLIDDLRFPHEVDAVHAKGGKVLWLGRKVHPEDTHDSETALDPENFDWSKFDKVIDNQNMTIEELVDEVYKTLVEFGWVE